MVDHALLALRRRISGWNEGQDDDLADVFFDTSVKRWIVTSWAGAMEVFHSHNPGRTLSGIQECPMATAASVEELLAQGEYLFSLGMVFQKSPDSERLRKTMMRYLGNKQMLTMAPQLSELADQLLEGAVERDSLDVVSEFAAPLVCQSLFGMLGIAPELWSALQQKLNRAAFLLFELNITTAERTAGMFAFAEIARIAREVLSDSKWPKTPMAAHWAEAVRNGVWSMDEATAQVAMLILAGTMTPITAMATMVHHLIRHPSAWAAARSGDLELERIIDESLRLGPPKSIVPKSLSSDITIGQQVIAAGQPILILVGRANRDPAQFPNPLEFNPWREEIRNLAFGDGSRRCPGMHLARMQLRVALSTLLKRLPRLELIAEPSWIETLHCERVLERLRIRVQKANA